MNTRITIGILLASTAMLASGCDRKPAATPTGTTTPGTATGTKADNTDRNAANRESETKSPMDQSNASADIKITADIRKAIMDDKAMSVNAQNCKIITEKGGAVTLRGPVDSQAERDAIEAKAKAIAGVTRVVNELEVKTK